MGDALHIGKRESIYVLRKIGKAVFYMVTFLIIATLLPQEIKQPIPGLWGFLEGSVGWDMTGFAFTPLHGHGKCRIVNGKAGLAIPGSKIVFGVVTPAAGKNYAHLWALDADDHIVDSVCSEEHPECRNRRSFAVIDSRSLKIVSQNPQSDLEKKHIEWGVAYLHGLRSAVRNQERLSYLPVVR